MGFNSAFKGLTFLKTPGNGRLNNLNDPVLNVLNCGSSMSYIALFVSDEHQTKAAVMTCAAALNLFRWYSVIKSVQRQPIYIL